MKRVLSILLLIVCTVCLAACSAEPEIQGDTAEVYYINNEETRVEIKEYLFESSGTEERIKELFEALGTVPEKLEYKAPLSMGFAVKDYRLENGTLMINMDENYRKLIPTTEILVRAAIVCTMTQLEDVKLVSFTVENKALYDNLNKLVGTMTADQFLNNTGSEIGNYDLAVLSLYFTNAAGDSLVAVNREKMYNTNISLDRLVVEELIAGPSAALSDVYPTVNPNTKIVSVMTKDGICYVNLDAEFLTQIYNVSADVTIYSIVNSLIELSNVNKVQISIDGDTSGVYREKYSFSTVFERNLDIVAPLSE